MPIPANPFARYRAAGLTPGAISSWPDEGSGGNDLVQATGARQPTAEAAGFNGHPSVLFEGGTTGDFMQTSAYASALSQGNTIVLLGEFFSQADGDAYFYADGLGSGRHAIIADWAVGTDPVRMFAGSVSNTGAVRGGFEGVPTAMVAVFNSTASRLYINNVAQSGSDISVGTQTLAGFTLNARIDGIGTEATGNVRLVEVLIYDRALDSTERADLQDYFDTTYAAGVDVTAAVEHGIVLGHQVVGDVEEETVTAAVEHGIVLGHQVEADSTVEASVEHGIVLGHQVQGVIGDAITAAVEHGIVFGHQVQAESTVETSVEHGLVLGHQVAGQVIGGATIRHGLIFGHEVEFEVRVPVDMTVEHGIVFGHAVVFDVEREITTRPIQPMAKLRPLQPMFTSTP